MKRTILLGLFFLIGVTLSAQNKNAKAIIEVDGVCLMCKDRIEKASIKFVFPRHVSIYIAYS